MLAYIGMVYLMRLNDSIWFVTVQTFVNITFNLPPSQEYPVNLNEGI